jgi:hypothetical protein
MPERETSLGLTIGQRLVAAVAIAFGGLTLFAGGRVLAGSDPGFVVYRPLLLYNTTMGLAYIAAGVVKLFTLPRGKYAAATIFLLNAIMFGFIGYLYLNSDVIAIDSMRAMSLRTGVWLVLFLALAWLERSNRATAEL